MNQDQSPFILSLDSPLSTLATTGGKGHNLSILSRDGSILVPNGFCVTISAYHEFIEGFKGEIEQLLSNLSTANLEEVSIEIRKLFNSHTLSPTLENEISRAIQTHFPNNEHLAIRSSGTCEDMPSASFAGQHDTYLNVSPTAENVCNHVINCFSSLFTSRAISYRENEGINHLNVGMAVVIQAMVHSEASGVLFTANPVSGRRNECVLEVVKGLGEALVSGMTEPDRYIVKVGKEITIKDMRVGKKVKSVVSAKGGGVQEVIDEAAANEAVLTEDQVKDLILLGRRVSALFNNTPQDIEFAISSEGTIYIVQSRPITTLFPLPDVPEEPLQIFFSFNAVQGISAPIFPAGEDALNGRNGILGGHLQYMTWGRFGHGRVFHRVAGRLYGNVTVVIRNSFGRAILRKLLPLAEPGILAGLEQEITEPGLEVNSGMNAMLILRLVSIGVMVLPRYILSIMFPDRARKRVYALTDEIVRTVEKEAEGVNSLADAIEFKQRTLKGIFPRFFLHFLPRMATAMHPLVLLMKLAEKLPDGKNQVLTITVSNVIA